MRIGALVLTPLLAFTAAAHASPMDDAKRALDEASPGQCELLTMQYQSNNGPAPANRKEAADRLYERAMQIQREQEPIHQRYEAAMRALAPQERQIVASYASQLMNQCMAKSPDVFRGVQPRPLSPDAPTPSPVR
ncbi:MAG: hypothetical protein ACXWG3_18790 [Usitatibacter sp.]